jgi:hypothetical protein
VLKIVLANIELVLEFILVLLGEALSFVLGQSVGLVLAELFQYVVVLILIWLAFRRMLGAQSIPVRAVECLAANVLRAVPKATRWAWAVLAAIIGGQRRSQNPPRWGDHR